MAQGRVSGLRARGGFELDIAWSGGLREQVRVKSHAGEPLNFIYKTWLSRVPLQVAGLFLLGTSLMATSTPAGERYDFGGNVASTTLYDDARGYGFEPVTPEFPTQRFSAKASEGNYKVTLRFGDRKGAGSTTVKAEARRLMIEDLVTKRGAVVTKSFIVNVRTPALAPPPPNAPGGSMVRLKQRELDSPTWDNKLTLEFLGEAPMVTPLTIERVDVPTVYLAGDSTVTDQRVDPNGSWGQMLPRFFKPDIAIANHAESGETLKSFLTELRLDKILATIRPGDWLLIQFGHNDQKSQWTQTYVDAATTYRDYLRIYIAEARRRGAVPILITSPERLAFNGAGHIVDSHGAYPDAVRDVAREQQVALVDLHSMSKVFYESLGPERAPTAFAEGGRDLTHHSNFGAYELARLVAQGLRTADPQLAAHLDPEAPIQ